MKEKASPAVIAAVVVVMVLLIGFLGWKFLGPGSHDSGQNPYGNMTGKNGPPSQYMPQSNGAGGPGAGAHGSSYGGPGTVTPGGSSGQ